MNSCILMADVVSDPELRATQDNREVSYMMVEFEALRSEEPPARIRVVGWGNLASEIKQKYTQGDRIVIEGRLSMNVVDLPEGYKEKRAELVASRIYPLNGQSENMTEKSTSYSQDNVSTVGTYPSITSPLTAVEEENLASLPQPTIKAPVNPSTTTNEDLDDIPF